MGDKTSPCTKKPENISRNSLGWDRIFRCGLEKNE